MDSVASPAIRIGSRYREGTLFIGGLAIAIGLHFIDPAQVHGPVCPFHAISGLYCPGCGTLRCLHALLHGDLRSAAGFNVLTLLLLPVIVVAWVATGVAALEGRPAPVIARLPRWVGPAIVVTTVSFWVLRNVPVAPFSWLAP
jgi:Protein of unknown function (DUF2752)